MVNLIELAKQCPNINVTVTAGELVEAINYCIDTARKELEQLITDANTETYPSIDKVCEILDVHRKTLYRWRNSGYLVPLEIGGKRRYRMSDVKRLLENEKEQS
jgi:excisionase family DNA binding protein